MKEFCSRRTICGVMIGTTIALSPLATFAAGTLPDATVSQVAFVEDTGATERINFSGKLRMLSQRIPAAACNYAAGVDSETSGKILVGATAEFTKIAAALEFGDESLGIIGEESRRKTLAALAKLHTQWDPMATAAQSLSQDASEVASFDVIRSANMDVLGAAKLLVTEISGQYSDPSAMVQADALLIDIAGRQRMLSQKMSKEACMAWSGANADEARAALTGTMQMFEVSLMALRDGLSAAGIKPAPTPEIAAGLDVVIGEWAAVKPLPAHAAEGSTADTEERARVFQMLNVLLRDMNATVGLYTEYGKSKL